MIWTSDVGADGRPLVSVDPVYILSGINNGDMDLLKGHDPGAPLGKILSAAIFKALDGGSFIAAILGFYNDSSVVGFNTLGVSPTLDQLPVLELPAFNPDHWIELCVDPRYVSPTWIEAIIDAAALRAYSDEAARGFRSYAARRSNLMAPTVPI